MNTEWVMLVDNREKIPLRFPATLKVWDPESLALRPRKKVVRLIPHSTRLLTGDYALQGYEDIILVERKKSLDELCNNLLNRSARARFAGELERMRDSTMRGVLLTEGTPHSLSQVRDPDTDPAIVRDQLFYLLDSYGIELWMMPTGAACHRAKTAEWMAARMIAAVVGAKDASLQRDEADDLAGSGVPSG